MKFDAFVSYSHADAELAGQVFKGLQSLDSPSRPFTVYLYEHQIALTEDIRTSVVEAISNSSALILPLTANSLDSHWVHFEIGCATAFDVEIFPLITPDLKNALQASRRALPIYFRTKAHPESVEQLVAHLASSKWRRASEFRKSLHRMRGETPQQFCLAAGLADIEHRTNTAGALPPDTVYRLARNEVALMGISLYRTMDQHYALVEALLDRNVQVRLLVLDPRSPDIGKVRTDWGHKAVSREIRGVARKIKETRVVERGLFAIRYMSDLPPFTCVMVDGDIEGRGPPAECAGAFLRLQPLTHSVSPHNAPVLQFHKMPGSGGKAPFDIYSEDLRQIWRKARGRMRWSMFRL